MRLPKEAGIKYGYLNAPKKYRSAMKKAYLSPPMKKAVDAEIKKITAPAEEIKYIATQWPERDVSANISTLAGADLYKMIPEVSQGVEANDRIGNALNPKGLRTHFVVSWPAEIVNTANVYIRFLCISSREVKDYSASPALSGSNLFLYGDGGTTDLVGQGFNDNLKTNQFLPVNKKSWIVHHDKTIHMARGFGQTNNDSTSPRTPTGYVPVCSTFTFDTPHKSAFKYDKPLDTTPNNFAPYWCCYMWTADAGTVVATPKVNTRTDLYYVG